MELIVISPTHQQHFEIVWLELNTPAGNLVIQPGHVATIVTLSPRQKITFCLKNGKRESMVIKEGVAHVTRSTTTLLLNSL